MGFIGMFINQFAYILGVVFTTPDTASMFQPLVPVVVTIAAILLRTEPLPRLKTKIGSAKIFGILLATGGALIMAYGKQTGSKSSDDGKNLTKPKPYGYLFLVINISASALWVVMQKKFIFNKANSRWRDYPINITAWTYFFGAISMGLASLYYADKPEKFVIHKIEVVYCLIYAVFITSALCYMLITWCNMQVNSSFVTASLLYLQSRGLIMPNKFRINSLIMLLLDIWMMIDHYSLIYVIKFENIIDSYYKSLCCYLVHDYFQPFNIINSRLQR